MIVTHPWLLTFGLLSIALPIAIHFLMRHQRKPIRWAAMRFVIEAYKKQRRRMRLEQLILLTLRCLLLAVVALALAKPILSRAGLLGSGSRDLYLLIDNSIASAARINHEPTASPDLVSSTTTLSQSIDQAKALLDQLEAGAGDRAAIITLASPASAPILPLTSDLDQVRRVLDSLSPADSRADWNGAYHLLTNALEHPSQPAASDSTPLIALLSPFSKGSLTDGEQSLQLDTAANLLVSEPIETPQYNVGLVRTSLLRPLFLIGPHHNRSMSENGTTPPPPTSAASFSAQLRVDVLRSGSPLDASRPTTITVLNQSTGKRVGSTILHWKPGQTTATVTISLQLKPTNDTQPITLETLIDRDDNPRDNRSLTRLIVRDQLRVALLGSHRFADAIALESFTPGDWLRLALAPEATNSPVTIDMFDAARFSLAQLRGHDAIFIVEPERITDQGWAALGRMQTQTGLIVLCPSPRLGAQLWTDKAVATFDLNWTYAREPIDVDPAEHSIHTTEVPDNDLLWLLRGELADLLADIKVHKLLLAHPKPLRADATDNRRDTSKSSSNPIAPQHRPTTDQIYLSGANNEPILIASLSDTRSATVVYLATPFDLEWTNLPTQPLFVPLMQEILRAGVDHQLQTATSIAGTPLRVPPQSVELIPVKQTTNRTLSVSNPQSAPIAIDPSTRLLRSPIYYAGMYAAFDASGVLLDTFAIAPDTQGALAGSTSKEDIARFVAQTTGDSRPIVWLDNNQIPAHHSLISTTPSSSAAMSARATGLGLKLLWIALAIAVVETVLARFFSHAVQHDHTASTREHA